MRRPLSILKYAMTLDGKIATSTVSAAAPLATPLSPLAMLQKGWRCHPVRPILPRCCSLM